MANGGRSFDLSRLGPQALATQIANQFENWVTFRNQWHDEKKELRNYIFATDTRKTSNNKLPWKNSTTLPKLCQIRDNLHANYMAALFPNENWLRWEAGSKDAAKKKKREVIENYMRNKTDVTQFRATVSQLVYDYIDYGNVFATTEFVNQTIVDEETGEELPGYIGPRVVRVSPLDIVFNPVAQRFEDSPKIIRSIKSIGDIQADIEDHPEMGYLEEAFNKIKDNRKMISGLSKGDFAKDEAFRIDGFGSLWDYFNSGFVEFLEFYGDIYDPETNKFLKNQIITVVDRTHIIRQVRNPSWRMHSFRHVGWRLRPDNLYAMGPLDNLVGMQYRIDHLENLKADVFDLIAHPVMKVKGFVEEFNYGPGEKIFLGDDGDVGFIQPDTTALNADIQIGRLEAQMEELAGAPKQAMGIRTPGEKTAFEVQTLENASGRIFQNKVSYFEQMFLEPLLNDMLECARRNMSAKDTIRVLVDDLDVVLFTDITKEDLNANGMLKPIGARHFATKANMLQNLVQFTNSAVARDPAVSVHISGIALAKAIEGLLEVERFGLVQENVRISEQAETQRMMNVSKQQVAAESITPSGLPGDQAPEMQMIQSQARPDGTNPMADALAGKV